MKKITASAIILLAAIIGSAILALAQFRLPNPLPQDAPDDQFSALRAIDTLQPLVSEPHPVGSTALVAVRENLVEKLIELGFQVEIQSATGSLPRYQILGRADNILARLPGEDSSGTLLLMAHYDSVPQGPGAGDNGAGVVTILESLRALSAQQPFRNDLIVLFTDAEEYGTLGAQAFVNQHPWMADISVVLNIEGTLKGSVVLVETGPENGWLVRNFRSASPHPLGYSWLFDLFGVMPNITDFMPFREAGLAGANLFSFNGGPYYHTPRDTIANMDARSLQQHGEQTQALIDLFSSIDLSETHAGNVIYFNLFSGLMVIYPSSWALPLAILAGLGVIAVLVWANRSQGLSFPKTLISLPGVLVCLISGPALAALLWFLIQRIIPQSGLYFPAHTYNDGWYALAFTAFAAGLTLTVYKLLLRRMEWKELFGAGLILISVLNLAVSAYLPGFSYLFTWPTLLAAVAWIIFLIGESGKGLLSAWGWILLILPSILLWLPVGLILFWSSGVNFLPVIALSAVIPLILISPAALRVLSKKAGWLLAAACGLIFVACLLGGVFSSSFSCDHPMPLRVQYFYNTSSGEAFWINPNAPLSSWQEQFTQGEIEEVLWSEIFPSFQSSILKSPAPAFDLGLAQVSVLEDSQESGERRIRLQVLPALQGDQLILSLPPGTNLQKLEADGQPWTEDVEETGSWHTFYYVSPPESGLEIHLVTSIPGPSMLMVTERVVGFENLPGGTILPRPGDIMGLGDYIFVNQTINLQ